MAKALCIKLLLAKLCKKLKYKRRKKALNKNDTHGKFTQGMNIMLPHYMQEGTAAAWDPVYPVPSRKNSRINISHSNDKAFIAFCTAGKHRSKHQIISFNSQTYITGYIQYHSHFTEKETEGQIYLSAKRRS